MNSSDCRGLVSNAELYWERLENCQRSFEPDSRPIVRPIHIVDVPELDPSVPQHENRERELSTFVSLNDYLENPEHENFQLRFISICQSNSWSRLQITKPMLRKIIEFHDIEAAFLDVPLCFFHCMANEDQTFCVPWTMSEDIQSYRVFYTFRYAEYKGDPTEPWVIRQSGVYHQYDKKKRTSLFVLLNPMPSSVAHKRVLKDLVNGRDQIRKDPLWLHSIVHASYCMRWREYIAEHERKLQPIADTTTATLISKPLRVSHDTLGKVKFLESRFVQVSAIIESFMDILDGLEAFGKILASKGSLAEEEQQQQVHRLESSRKLSRMFMRTAKFLEKRSNITATLLADTLAFRNQGIAQDQNLSMLFLTRSAVFITVITLVYLPWTLVTGLFGMEFFELDPQTRRLVTSPQIWIYFAVAAGVTVITMMLYYVMAGFPQIRPVKKSGGSGRGHIPASLLRGYTDVEKDGNP